MIRTSTGRWIVGPAILMVALVVGLAGCNRGQTAADVMAKVNGRKILRSEVDKYYAHQTANSPQQPSDEQSTSLKLGILKELIDNEILMQRAEKLGLLATNEEVDQKLNEIKAPYTQEEFDKRLNERKITLDDFKRDLRRSITIDKVLNREIASKISISDADITSYYNAHKAEFNLIEPQYHLAHIFVTTQPNSQVRNLKNDKAQNEGDARKKVQMIMNRLDSGEDFASVAMNYSEDPESAGNGGDLGFTPQSALAKTDPATRDAVSKLKPGQYSNVIVIANPETHQVFGFRIVKL
ncbi:MAG: SurA N-terminal domain-containing protein, partial [Terriglobales bacterium]